MSNLVMSTPKSNIGAYRSIRYHPKKAYKVSAEVSSTTWVPTATIMAPGGQRRENLGILGGLEMSHLAFSCTNSNTEAYRSIRYHPEKVFKARTKVSVYSWSPRVTNIAPGG